jgi:RHS repeat-associated protein
MAMPGRNGKTVTGGGWAQGTTKVNGVSVSETLTIDTRTDNTPAEYKASTIIEFTDGFISGSTDEFTAFIADATNTSTNTTGTGNSNGSTDSYRYGFNGKELDGDMDGNNYDYGFRIYNPQIGRFLSIDPLAKDYPWNSTYAFAENSPILNVDLEGLEKLEAFFLIGQKNSGQVLVKGQKALQVSYDFETKVTTIMYGSVGGKTVSVNYDVAKKQYGDISYGNLSEEDVAKKYGQVGTKLSKSQLSKLVGVADFINDSKIPLTGLKVSDLVDRKLYEQLEKLGFKDLFVHSNELIKKFQEFLKRPDVSFQVTETNDGTAIRFFDNSGADIDDIHLNLILAQYILPEKIDKPQKKNPINKKSEPENKPSSKKKSTPVPVGPSPSRSDHSEDRRTEVKKSKK